LLWASTEAFWIVQDVMEMSLRAFSRAFAPMVTALLVSTVIEASASPTDTRPPPLLADMAETLALAVPPTWMSCAVRRAPAPTVTCTVGVEDALTSESLTRTKPPPEPLAAAVTTPSPEGAPASARAPPTPSKICVPLPSAMMSMTSRCWPLPAFVRSTLSLPSVLVPVRIAFETGSSGFSATVAPPGAASNRKLSASIRST